MICPNCQYDNRDDAKFCLECGEKLELLCPQCDKTLPSSAKFCDECGHKISQPAKKPSVDISFQKRLDKIQKYLPKGLTKKILTQRDKIEGERKHITVMFCDLQGYTTISEKLGPEEAYATMDEVYEILIHKVHDYEGTVNEMTGDGIVAFFGAPIALEDAPQRAIRSGFAIHREMAKFGDRMKQENKLVAPFKMRIGIHTGPVVVGTIGNDLRVEFKAVGDTVNLASRIENLAEPGTTYLTEDTFKLTEGLFRFEALGERKIKGKEEPVRIYRAIAPSSRRTRFDVSAERGLTLFVGRDRELELLLDGFERVKEGRGQAFSIVAEAGLGKSRLLYEFRKAVINENATFLEGRCLSYSKNVAYHPLIDRLKSNFDIKEGDADAIIRDKVINGLKVLGIDEASTLPYILELFAVKDSGIDKIQMSQEARKVRILEAVKRITFKGSEIRPLILATEDLHWIDKSSEEYLKDLLDSISGSRIFLIFTYRPEYVHTWGAKSYHSQINLNRLSNRGSLNMLSYLLGTESVEKDLAELLLEKTEGIPFFIEEFVKSLIQLRIIEKKDGRFQLVKGIQEVTIPATIQDVIMARVDSLAEGAKEVLQTGTAIEREFDHKLIKHVTGLPDQELLSHMSVLKDSELIYERGIFPNTTYIFKHALTREVVYESILSKRKTKLHAKIGNAIEEIFGENIVEQYEVLAEHYITGEDYEKGAEYSRLAGKKAEKTALFVNALAYGQKGISCLEKLPLTDDVQEKIIDARTILGLYFIQLGQFSEAQRAIDPIIEVAVKSGNQKRLAQIHTIIGLYSGFNEEDIFKALDHLKEALKISEEIGHKMSIFFASYCLSLALWLNCEFEEAINLVNKSLEINVDTNSLWGIVAMKAQLASYYSDQGKIDLAYQTGHEALQKADESGDIYSKAFSLTFYGISCYYKGFYKEALDCLLKAVNFSERLDFWQLRIHAQSCLGHLYYDIGEYDNSKLHYSKAISIGQRAEKAPSEITFYKSGLAKAKVMSREKDIDLKLLLNKAGENRLKPHNGQTQRYIGEILLNFDGKNISEAENWIKKAIETDKQNGMRWHLARDYASIAEVYKRKGDPSKALDNLNTALEILKECGADGWVDRYEKERRSLKT